MKTTLSVQNEIKQIELELETKAELGREYFSDEATELKKRLNELRDKTSSLTHT